jgi:hypothetical protein
MANTSDDNDEGTEQPASAHHYIFTKYHPIDLLRFMLLYPGKLNSARNNCYTAPFNFPLLILQNHSSFPDK